MTSEETEEGNKIIAEFMDYRHFGVKFVTLKYNQFLYHSSWDWLMPVYERLQDKIILMGEDEGYFSKNRERIEGFLDQIRTQMSLLVSIEGVFSAIVETIKWYNQQKK